MENLLQQNRAFLALLMNIKEYKKCILLVLPLLVLAGVAVFLSSSNRENFNGSRVKNPDAYFLDIQKMNGTDLHTLELCEGDVLQIQFETEKGSLYMEIKAPDGTSLYRGNGKETTEIEMTPINKWQDFERLTIAIDKKTNSVVMVRFTTRDGSKNKLTISNYNSNNKYTNDLFQFNKNNHPGVEIIDLR